MLPYLPLVAINIGLWFWLSMFNGTLDAPDAALN
jgi:hypothetical protein